MATVPAPLLVEAVAGAGVCGVGVGVGVGVVGRWRGVGVRAEVDDLKSGRAAVEERARSELGMIKPGETLYRTVEPAPAPPPAGADGLQ